MKGIFPIDTLLRQLTLIYLFYIKKHTSLNKRSLEVNKRNLEVFHASYEFKNHTFDAFLSQNSSTHAGSFLLIISVRTEIEK